MVLDNLSTGRRENLQESLKSPNLELIQGDCGQHEDIERATEEVNHVFHLAANSEIHRSDPTLDFQENILATRTLLNTIQEKQIERLTFTSTSTVYGEPQILPTPEHYGPLRPISSYGASKLACEALISSHSHLHGIRSTIHRLANIVGSRTTHGVIHDFIKKLRADPHRLEILGDGTQTKSYLHVEDCIDGILQGDQEAREQVEIYNLGSDDQIPVTEIANIVTEEMKLRHVTYTYTGGVDGGRGWPGDVKNMLLDTTKLKSTGWKPRHSSREAVQQATRELLRGP